jgi:organic hydroperoxide reductase OsmC/OhrA
MQLKRVAQALVDGALLECPYSKATQGNIDVVTNVITTRTVTVGA